jgi:hypothetical protein
MIEKKIIGRWDVHLETENGTTLVLKSVRIQLSCASFQLTREDSAPRCLHFRDGHQMPTHPLYCARGPSASRDPWIDYYPHCLTESAYSWCVWHVDGRMLHSRVSGANNWGCTLPWAIDLGEPNLSHSHQRTKNWSCLDTFLPMAPNFLLEPYTLR